MSGLASRHLSVLLDEALDLLSVREGGRYIDATAGGGGHTRAILARAGGSGRVLAIDRDPAAVARLAGELESEGPRCRVIHGNFAELSELTLDRGWERVDGIIMDVGVSSDQLDSAARGFSFQVEGPLDMRMDSSRGATAADLVNTQTEDELAGIFEAYGEEPRARQVARRIVAERGQHPLRTTVELAELVERVSPRRGRTHPATRVFQALRIAVNAELDALERGVEAALSLLKDEGRLVVISFHSLEDRVVKQAFRRHRGRWESLPQGGRRWVGDLPEVRILTPKPVRPGPEEERRNPRARSARLRAAERMKTAGAGRPGVSG